MKHGTLTIGLLWHSVDSRNLGLGALTLANIALIRHAAAALGVNVSFVVIGWLDDQEPYVVDPDVTVAPISPREHLKRPGRLIATIRSCDVVFDIGAGDSFSDLYGVKRFLYLAATKALVLAVSVPLVLSPQTIGPYRHRWVRRIAGQLLKRADSVVVRDRLSRDYLRAMKIRCKCVEATDVAFALPADSPPLLPSDKLRIGINVSGLLFNGGAENAQRLGLSLDYAVLMEKIMERFTWMKDCEVHLVGHVFADDSIDDDRQPIKWLAARFPEVVIAPEFTSPMRAKAYIGTMDFFIGARMHACIAAFSTGVPVVPTAYSRKFSGLFGSLGYHHVADCTRDDISEALDAVMRGFTERDTLREQIRTSMESAREKLSAYESVITQCLQEAARRRPLEAGVSQAA